MCVVMSCHYGKLNSACCSFCRYIHRTRLCVCVCVNEWESCLCVYLSDMELVLSCHHGKY